MLRFENNRLDTGIDDLSREKPYIGIKPFEDLSDLEVTAFINKEFEKAQKEIASYPYDDFISEIFDCSKEDIFLDYEISDRTRKIIDEFKAENWNLLTDAKRLSTVEKLIDSVSEDLNIINVPKVNVSENDNGSYGDYSVLTNTITLNCKYLSNPIETVDTVAHELRHAYQHERAEIMETREDVLYKLNFENYIAPAIDSDGYYLNFYDYYYQYIEVEARAFADIFTEAIS